MLKKINICVVILSLIFTADLVFAAGLASTDYNYINDHVGGRATGMGGAYTAISDDPSGAYYNPAGIVFAMDNQISLSVNSYKGKKVVIEEVISGEDYTQDISSFYPSFFGVVQSFGKAKIAATIININTENLDQDDFFSNVTAVDDENTAHNGNYNINYNIDDNTMLFGLSYAMFITDSITVGVTAYGVKRHREEIVNQMITYEKTTEKTYFMMNQYLTEDLYGAVGVAGVQWMPMKKLALGLSYNWGGIFTHDMDAQIFSKSESAGKDLDEVNNDDQNLYVSQKYSVSYDDSKLPMVIRGGAAYFFSKRLALSLDLIGHVGSKYYQNDVNHTLNGALGVEYYVTDSFPVRAGLFTNMANSSAISKDKMDQDVHVDMYGSSLSLSWQTRSSSISLSGYFQTGKGEAQAVSNSDSVQDVSVYTYSISLTGTAKY